MSIVKEVNRPVIAFIITTRAMSKNLNMTSEMTRRERPEGGGERQEVGSISRRGGGWHQSHCGLHSMRYMALLALVLEASSRTLASSWPLVLARMIPDPYGSPIVRDELNSRRF